MLDKSNRAPLVRFIYAMHISLGFQDYYKMNTCELIYNISSIDTEWMHVYGTLLYAKIARVHDHLHLTLHLTIACMSF